MNINKKKQLLLLLRQYKKQKQQVDLTSFQGAFANWLRKQRGIDILRDIVEDNKDDINKAKQLVIKKVYDVVKKYNIKMSDTYFKKFKSTINKQRNTTGIHTYLYNVTLKGAGLGLH